MFEENKQPKSENKHRIIYGIFGVLVSVAAITGVSTALYTFSHASENANAMGVANMSMSLLESTDVIDITNGLPMPDSEGILLDEDNSFDFAVTSDITDTVGKINYKISISKVEPTTGYTALPNNNVKMYLTHLGDNGETQVMAPRLVSDIITSGTSGILPFDSDKNSYLTHSHNLSTPTITSKFRLRMWIDENATASTWTEDAKLEFKVKINVSGTFAK